MRLSKIGVLDPALPMFAFSNCVPVCSLDMHHQIFLKVLDGKLTLAPLDRDPPKRILDVGTGTGIWALDIAE